MAPWSTRRKGCLAGGALAALVLVGVVVGTAMDRTAVVAVQRFYPHPRTRKVMRHITKFFAHDHHEHCSERGLHLHEGDDSCQWTDPAYLAAPQPVAIGWELMPHTLGRNEPVARVASAKNADSEAVALRGPPVG